MNIWGQRFTTVDSFISYCRDLRIETDRRELEHYEQIGVMLPVARVVYPDEYVIQRDLNTWNGTSDCDETGRWPALDRLSEGFRVLPYDYRDLTDEELVHCFDREMNTGDNPHLVRPNSDDYKPWSNYRVTVTDRDGNNIKRSTVEHYYSYWQIHQLYYIQRYPDLYKNVRLIELIPEDAPLRSYRPWAPKKECLVDFCGKRINFDALSFWNVVYEREHHRTFLNVPDIHGVRALDERQTKVYRSMLLSHAEMVRDRYSLDKDELYRFLSRLIDIYDEYERYERQRLMRELKKDIFAWEDLVRLLTGETRETVADELEQLNRDHKEIFLYLDVAAKERDYAIRLLDSISRNCRDTLNQYGNRTWSFATSEVTELIDYCYQKEIGLLPTALSGMVAIGEEEYQQNFRRVQRYTNLKNVLTSYEYLLKSLARNGGLNVDRDTLTPLVEKVIVKEKWHKLFHQRKQKGLLKGKNSQEFLMNLGTLLGDCDLNGSVKGYWAQQFLITCLARNMTIHSYPSEDSYYGDLFGPMLKAVVNATFYTWRLAKANAWI